MNQKQENYSEPVPLIEEISNRTEIRKELGEMALDRAYVEANETEEDAKMVFQNEDDTRYIKLNEKSKQLLDAEQLERQRKLEESKAKTFIGPAGPTTPEEEAEQTRLKLEGTLDRDGH